MRYIVVHQQAWTGSAFNHELVGLMDVTFNEIDSYQKKFKAIFIEICQNQKILE